MSIDLASMSVGGYLDALAAAQPVPGGGAVAGVTLAQANALGSMVVGYAIGKAKFAAHDAAHRAAHETFERGRRAAIELAAEDAKAYEHLNRLWKLPKGDPLRAGFDAAVLEAIRAPDESLALAKSTLDALAVLVGTTSASLASDLRIAIDLAAVGARAAQENVRINLPSVADESARTEISARTEAVLAACESMARELAARA
ncbi:MAG: cyclodeaminase/cyclohydrolase family protein [Planctomycetota bacterium]|nr:cyclodeaminase/cyclohydrolase family protein [Planctomycetota bacterium]